MIFKESDLNNISSLDNYAYLKEEESKINVSTIPVVENTRLNSSLVDISYVEKLAEENCMSLIDAVNAIQEQNDIDNISVVVNEERIVSDPDIVNEMNSVIIKPMSENDPVAVYVETVCEEYLNSQDTRVFDNILDENKLEYGLRRLKTKATTDDINKNPNFKRYMKRGAAINAITGFLVGANTNSDPEVALDSLAIGKAASAANLVNGVYQHFKSKPKNIIEKAIIKLRRIYHSWMLKARDARKSEEGNIFSNAASVVLQIIDKLLELVQKGAHKLG